MMTTYNNNKNLFNNNIFFISICCIFIYAYWDNIALLYYNINKPFSLFGYYTIDIETLNYINETEKFHDLNIIYEEDAEAALTENERLAFSLLLLTSSILIFVYDPGSEVPYEVWLYLTEYFF